MTIIGFSVVIGEVMRMQLRFARLPDGSGRIPGFAAKNVISRGIVVPVPDIQLSHTNRLVPAV